MIFSNQTILIACSDKKDRLQCFNYFDELDADKIFTASDLSQMEEMLASEENYAVLVFEISKTWFQNNQQIINLKNKYPALKLIGLVSQQIGLNHEQYKEIRAHLNDLVFSPVMQHELLAKAVGQNTTDENTQLPTQKTSEFDAFLAHIFQPSGLPQMVINVIDHQIIAVNTAFTELGGDIKGDVWHHFVVDAQGVVNNKINASLKEKGHAKTRLKFKFKSGIKMIELKINSITLDDNPYYLAEVYDLTLLDFYTRHLNYLELVTTLDFESESQRVQMQKVLSWAQFDFCFVVAKDQSGEYNKIQWDCSLQNFAQKFISVKHDFLIGKAKAQNVYSLGAQAHQKIPADEFLSFFAINSILVCDLVIDDKSDAVLIAGAIKKPHKWDTLTVLFKQLAIQYSQAQAYKSLQSSHQSESQYDALTGLLNRRYILKAIEQSLAKGTDLKAVMFLDLDRFKAINDSLGHDVGDDVLINVAKTLMAAVSGHGIASRYAGDEFLILLTNKIDEAKVTAIAQSIIQAVAEPINLKNGSEIKLTVSLGIAYYPQHGQTVDKLIKRADVALYDAKLNGKNQISVYSDTLNGDQPKQNEEMVKKLKVAIESDQMEVFFQPKINANTEDIMGFEALVRWQHPELGLISPGLFIPLAEQSGLIDQIGTLVMHKSCQMLKAWQDEFNLPLNMSINLSPIQLNDKKLPQIITQVIKTTGIYPNDLDFEITESEKFKSADEALHMLNKITEIGCSLSIDDFGTGHSTLDYLRKIPAKTLKIDQVFVKNIGLSPDDEAILDATIDLAKRVGHKIVAEGVETEEQRLYLLNKGCDFFQGFLYCRPIPANEIHRILTQRADILKKH